MMSKQIHIKDINRIKLLSLQIFELEDDDYVDRRQTTPKYKAIDRIIEKITTDKNLQRELYDNIDWACVDCIEKLEALGWNIVRGKENYE